MKNETMVRAITDIDDALILEAKESAAGPKSFFSQYKVLGAAACLALICLLGSIGSLLFPAHSMEILLYGNAVSDEVQLIEMPVLAEGMEVRQTGQTLSVPLELNLKEGSTAQVEVSAGELSVFDAETGQVLSDGMICQVQKDDRLEWLIEEICQDKTYTIRISTGNDTVQAELSWQEEQKAFGLRLKSN